MVKLGARVHTIGSLDGGNVYRGKDDAVGSEIYEAVEEWIVAPGHVRGVEAAVWRREQAF